MSETHYESCPACGSGERRVHTECAEFCFVVCVCGLIYKSRDSEAREEASNYGPGYFDCDRASGRSFGKKEFRRIWKSRIQLLDVLNHVSPGPVLDVGCSLGYTLKAARELGLSAAGIDISAHAVQRCRESGFEAEVAQLEERLPFEDGRFQIVTAKHVLEHTPSPRFALAEIARVLRPGGGLFVAVPNAEYYKVAQRGSDYHFFQPGRGGSEHYVYYTAALLRGLLDGCGFDTVQVHPALIHRRVPRSKWWTERLRFPFYSIGQWLLTVSRRRREFWLVAVRRG